MSTYVPIAPRPAPATTSGWVGWCQSNLFHNWTTSLGTVLIGLIFLALAPKLFNWAIADAVFNGGHEACHAAHGACWAVVKEKFRFMILGRYPQEEHWRALLCTTMLLSLILASCTRAFWKPWLLRAAGRSESRCASRAARKIC